MVTCASLRELHESGSVFGAIIGNFMLTSVGSQSMICLQRKRAIDLYSIMSGDRSKFAFVLSYDVNAKIREVGKIPVAGAEAIVIWCEECKVIIKII